MNKVTLYLLPLFLFSCTADPELKDFEPSKWKKDRNGCSGLRKKELKDFKEIKDNLTGVSESKLLTILGKPDKQNLQEQQKKSYKYYAEPGKQCADSLDKAKMVIIEFNSIRNAKLITITYN